MSKPARCFVEILFVEDYFVSFDFATFAIILEKNGEGVRIFVCPKKDYLSYFMDFFGEIDITICCEESVIITLGNFKYVESLVSRKRGAPERAIFSFLKRVFPDQVRLLVQ